MITHFRDCTKATKDWEKERDEFIKLFPNYCKTCNGWGGHWYEYDPSPSGVSLAPGKMRDFNECPDCYEKGRCPHCGSALIADPGEDRPDRWICWKCEWTDAPGGIVGTTFAAGIPEPPECWCDFRRDRRDYNGQDF